MDLHMRMAITQDLELIVPLVGAYHEFERINSAESERRSSVWTLLNNPAFGAIWLIYADKKLVGYIALCRGYSIEFNGFDAFVDEFYLYPEFRGKGIGTWVLEAIKQKAREIDVNALHLEVARNNANARKLYAKAGFEARENYVLMTATLGEHHPKAGRVIEAKFLPGRHP